MAVLVNEKTDGQSVTSKHTGGYVKGREYIVGAFSGCCCGITMGEKTEKDYTISMTIMDMDVSAASEEDAIHDALMLVTTNPHDYIKVSVTCYDQPSTDTDKP